MEVELQYSNIEKGQEDKSEGKQDPEICTNIDDINTQNQNLRNNGQREKNIIIHGVNEGGTAGHDATYLNQLFDILQVKHIIPAASHRLGKKNEKKARPIKITMKCIADKDELMSKLGNLKNANNKFKKINVTDDYTIKERNEIRQWVEKSKEMNNDMQESDFVWKVRGTPKIGM